MLEAGFTELANAGFSVRPLRAATIALACYSILFCTLLGFMGPQAAFKRANPTLFEKLAGQFDAS